MIRTILFDVMGTIVYDPYRVELPAFFGMTFDELIRKKDPTVWPRFETGEISESEFLEAYFPDTTQEIDRTAFRDHLRKSYRFLPGMEALMRRLRDSQVECHAITNYPNWYTLIEDELALSKFLPWTFVSCELGVRKPDARIYEIALQRLNLPAESVLFVDDRKLNVDAARSCGIDAIQFEDAAMLSQQLRQRKLIS